MSRKADINHGALAAVGVLSLGVGMATGSIWGFIIPATLFGGMLRVLRVIR
jgi:hypothetical protein